MTRNNVDVLIIILYGTKKETLPWNRFYKNRYYSFGLKIYFILIMRSLYSDFLILNV